jgi:hypothetical protein
MCGKVRGVVSLGCGKEGCGKDQGVGRIRAWEKLEIFGKSAGEVSGEDVEV